MHPVGRRSVGSIMASYHQISDRVACAQNLKQGGAKTCLHVYRGEPFGGQFVRGMMMMMMRVESTFWFSVFPAVSALRSYVLHITYIHTTYIPATRTFLSNSKLQTRRSGLDSNTNQPCTVICVCTHRVSLVSQGCLPVPGWSTRSVTTAPVGAPGFPAPHPRKRHASAVAIRKMLARGRSRFPRRPPRM